MNNLAEEPENSNRLKGSPNPGEPVFLAVGLLRRPHGVHGEMVMDFLTDFPERLQAGRIVYSGDEHRVLHVGSRRTYENACLISFKEFDSREQVEALRNAVVYVRSDEIPQLPAGEYYHHQMLGLSVKTEDGSYLGKVVDILETGVNDVYVVRPEHGPEILLPVIDEVVLGVDLAAGELQVRLLPGLAGDQK